MRLSDQDRHYAAEAIRRLEVELDGARIAALIDEPVDRAAQSFVCPDQAPLDHLRFLDTMGHYVRHIYREAFPGGQQLTPGQAGDEALALLERGYEGRKGRGYDEALADASEAGEMGLLRVLLQVAELIKALTRQKHIQRILSEQITRSDFGLRCAVAQILLEHVRPYLPSEQQTWPLERWACLVEDLLETYFMFKNPLAAFFRMTGTQ